MVIVTTLHEVIIDHQTFGTAAFGSPLQPTSGYAAMPKLRLQSGQWQQSVGDAACCWGGCFEYSRTRRITTAPTCSILSYRWNSIFSLTGSNILHLASISLFLLATEYISPSLLGCMQDTPSSTDSHRAPILGSVSLLRRRVDGLDVRNTKQTMSLSTHS